MVRKAKDYSNGKVYVIRNTINTMVYIGSTTQALSKRMAEHRIAVNKTKCQNYKIYQKMREIGVDKFYIELLELCPCNTQEELLKKEGETIRQFDSYNNGYNSMVAGRTKKEWCVDNQDVITEYKREYYENNKAVLVDKMREYYEDNKAVLAVKMREYQEANKEVIAAKKREYMREYREANREAINAKEREKYALKKAQS